MGAKAKLNAANFYGAAIVAGLIGWLAGSWTVFLVALGLLLIAGLHAGSIRR